MKSLSSQHCVPCRGGVPALKGPELASFHSQLQPGWKLIEQKQIEKEYKFQNFLEALAFVNRVGEIAEAEGHHPDISFGWGYCKLLIWTHKIQGLTANDFILAAKCDDAYPLKDR